MHLSYNEYIAAGGKPGLTNWVKYNWLGDTTMIAAKNKYLVIKDLPTFHTSPDTSTFQIQAIRKNAEKVYGITMNLATGRDIKDAYRTTDITDSRVKDNLKICNVILPDNINTVDEAATYLTGLGWNIFTSIFNDTVKATLAVEKVPDNMKWFCEDFINI